MSIKAPISRSDARTFSWLELYMHVGLDAAERDRLLRQLEHWMLVHMFCNGTWEAFPLEAGIDPEDVAW